MKVPALDPRTGADRQRSRRRIWLAGLAGAAAQYRDALRTRSGLGHQRADFTVHGIGSLRVGGVGIRELFFVWRRGEAAQAERQLSDLGGDRDHLALLWRHLERRGMGDEGFTVLAVELLVDPDHPHIVQHRFCSPVRCLAAGQLMGDQNVDLIAGKDKTRDAGGGGDWHRDGAHTWTQHRSEKAATTRRDDLGVADRLARRERIARHPARKALRGPGPRLDVILIDAAFRPDLPGKILRFQDLAAAYGTTSHQHELLRWRGLGERFGLRVGPLREKGPDQHGGAASQGEGDDEKGQSACAHGLLPAEWSLILGRYWLKHALPVLGRWF